MGSENGARKEAKTMHKHGTHVLLHLYGPQMWL